MKVISITGEDDFQAQRDKLKARLVRLLAPLDQTSIPTVVALWSMAEIISERIESIDADCCEDCNIAWTHLHEACTLLNVASERIDTGVDYSMRHGK